MTFPASRLADLESRVVTLCESGYLSPLVLADNCCEFFKGGVWLHFKIFLLENLFDDLLLVVEPGLQLLHVELEEVERSATRLAEKCVEPDKMEIKIKIATSSLWNLGSCEITG